MAINLDWGNQEYEPRMCLEIIAMFAEGKTRSQFCAKYSISSITFERWRKRFKLFDKAYVVACEQARAYYDDLRHRHLVEEHEGAKLNTALFNRMYNARFNVPDKRLVKIDKLAKAKNEKDMLDTIKKSIAKGELTVDEAQKLASLIDVSLKIKQVDELEARLKAVEEATEIGRE